MGAERSLMPPGNQAPANFLNRQAGGYAPDEKAAEAAAVAEFKIGEEQRRRLVVRPDNE